MRFLIDRCAGRRLAEWLEGNGHDVVESRTLGPDPGDRALLELAAQEQRILVTLDTDFGRLAFAEGLPHCGMVRLPDVPPLQRIEMMQELLAKHVRELEAGAVVTIRGKRIRISRTPRTQEGP